METFKVLAKIKYKNDFFYVLINNACQKYFIKEFEDGSIMYPTEDEYRELNSIFNKKQVLASLNIGKDYKISPKIIMRSGKLLVLGAALLVIGSMVPTLEIDEENQSIVEQTDYNVQDKVNLEEAYRKGGYEFHSLYGYEEQKLYRIQEYVVPTRKLRVIECQNFEEFASFIDTKAKPTYDDVRETLSNNPNIAKKYKKWLLEGLNNLEKCMPDVDLTVLNFNLNRLKLEETTAEKLQEESDGELLAGRFDAETGKAYFIDMGDDNSNKFILYHEVLGHGISEASFEKEVDDNFKYGEYSDWTIQVRTEKIVISDSIFIMRVTEDSNEKNRDVDFFYVGQGHEEGKADQIAKFAMGNDRISGHPYIELSEQLRIMCEAVGLSFEEYISNGGAEILSQRMQENDVNNSLIYIVSDDVYVRAMRANSMELIDRKDTFKENVLAFFKDYADNKIRNGESREEIVAKFSRILAEGGEFIHSTFNSEEIDYIKFQEDISRMAESIENENTERED